MRPVLSSDTFATLGADERERQIMEPIEFKPRPPQVQIHSLEKSQKRDYSKPYCAHGALLISEQRGVVTCKYCQEEMSPLTGILLLCNRVWWDKQKQENQIEFDLKRVSKVQGAAFKCLFDAGITPDKYAVRWAREDENRRTAAVGIAPSDVQVKEG